MTERNPMSQGLRRAGAAAALLACTLASPPAGAHFTLEAPPSWMSQDFLGSPQKLGPCGDEAGGSSTGTVTAFTQGDTITVTIDEKIFHPGHYRIALAVNDRSELPAEPVVTPGAGTPCGSVEIQDPPVFPVLADGLWPHTAAFSGPQTVQIKLPADVTCTHCTLQVIEFMSNHPLNNPGGCYYHHCADIAINASTMPDAGGGGAASTSSGASTSGSTSSGAATTGAGGAGVGGAGGEGGSNTPSSSGGCGCSTQGGNGSALAGLAGLLILATRRRRRVTPAAR